MKKLFYICVFIHILVLQTGCRHEGCTNINAENWDPDADYDDGTCIICDCMDPNALNYNPSATTDGGNCYYPPDVKYSVVCADCDITYNDKDDNTKQQTVHGTWNYARDLFGFLYISAQNNTEFGDVIVTILIDGKIYKTNNCSNSYCIATASGTP